MSAAYDPNPINNDFPANLPFDYQKGTIDFARFCSWEKHDPLTMVDSPEYRDGLSALSLLYLDCGRQDEYLLQFGARRFADKLTAYGIRHHYEEFDGGHRGGRVRFSTSIPQLIHACS